MDSQSPLDGDSTDTKSVILRATFETLREFGYAGLSMSRIAERSELSKSSVYHHYQDKDELLYEFLNEVIDQLEHDFSRVESTDPVIALEATLVEGIRGYLPDEYLAESTAETLPPNSGQPSETFDAFIEVRAQAVHDENFRDRITELDETLEQNIAQIIESGVEQGVFRDVDPEMVAQTLLTLILGAIVRRTTSEKVNMRDIQRITLQCVEACLLREDVDLTLDL